MLYLCLQFIEYRQGRAGTCPQKVLFLANSNGHKGCAAIRLRYGYKVCRRLI